MFPTPKLYLGGYRNAKTGQIYHNAESQTAFPPIVPAHNVSKLSRETQTVQSLNKIQQTPVDRGTQCEKFGVIGKRGEKIIVANSTYESSDETVSRFVLKVINVQKIWRGHKARQLYEKLKEEKQRLEFQQVLKEQMLENESRCGFQQHLVNGSFQTKQDFERSYNLLEKWKKEQMARLESGDQVGLLRKVALGRIVQQEAQYLALIDQRKQAALREKQDKLIDLLLQQVTEPKLWKNADGKLVQVITPEIHKLRKLKNLYYNLRIRNQGRNFVNERLDRLSELRSHLQDDGVLMTKLTNEIQRLVDREIELLARRTSAANYGSLRQRINFLFLQYILLYYHFQSAEQNGVVQTAGRMAQCQSCSQFKSLQQFFSSMATEMATRCRSCRELDNSARYRQEYKVYRRILTSLREQEAKSGYNTGPAFLLQVRALDAIAAKEKQTIPYFEIRAKVYENDTDEKLAPEMQQPPPARLGQ